MSSRSLPVRALSRLGAISGRLVLLAVIAAATGVLLGALALPAAMATNDIMASIRNDVLDVPPLGEADTPPQNSYVYASDGQELAELTFEENRVPVALADIPQDVINAVLATEDANYYEHDGVNHAAIVRAAAVNFSAGGIESGASTITQQYVKMTFLTPEQTLGRKVEEALYALQLEKELDKDEILERYLNRSYFGAGTYGIGTAAERYFSKGIGELSLGEGAMLAGLLRAPEANNPINNIENASDRRDIVLRQMASAGFVSPPQAQAAIDQELLVSISEPTAPLNPFWSRWVSQLLVNEDFAAALGTQESALRAMGDTSDERRRVVFQSGLRIHTTLDPQMQEIAEQTLRDHLTYEDEPAGEVAQEPLGALVSVEPGTGAIRSLASGPREFGGCLNDGSWVGQLDDGQLLCDKTEVNVAVPGSGGSGRQPGSAFKPVVAAAALEDGLSPGLVLDARGPQPIEGCTSRDTASGLWEPRNSGGNDILDMYEAMARSSNVYHALLIADVTPPRVAEMSERLSGYPVAESEIVCPMALGTNTVTPLEMATMYATLANRGEYCAPFPIDRIEDANGRLLWQHQPDCRQVIDTEVADRVVDILEGPVLSGGTAPIANLSPYPTRGKTGSTNDAVDAWFVGFVKQLATAAWVGYPQESRVYETNEQATAVCGTQAGEGVICPAERQVMQNVTVAGQNYTQVFGGTIPAPLWADYMGEVIQRYEPEGFPDPGPIPTAQVPDLLQAGSIEEAEEIAIAAGFRLDLAEVNDWRPAGTFVEQTPPAGTDLALGARIRLGISDGAGDFPILPDVLGLTLDEAADLLFRAGYSNVFQRPIPTEDPNLIGRVVATSPGPGARVPPNSSDGVLLNIGIEPEEPEQPEEPEEPDESDTGGTDDDPAEDDGGDSGSGPGNSGGAGNGGGGPGGND